jgi:hypothetical protein
MLREPDGQKEARMLKASLKHMILKVGGKS